MQTQPTPKTGIKLLIEKYRDQFRIPENINYYSEKDLKIAERKYLKFILRQGDGNKALADH
ncbi:MAG: hypothetical protein QNI92_07145 [Desulfobacterales bacterium]|nr:hypothetical protein [Desulfobacterales bacterium]MDJ0912269.1 hypothetical protein [Desulfobacterales bacterium]